MSSSRKSSAFVHLRLSKTDRRIVHGPLTGLTAAVKDMYDIAGERTGGGSPEWLLRGLRPKPMLAPWIAVERRSHHYRQDRLRRILLQPLSANAHTVRP